MAIRIGFGHRKFAILNVAKISSWNLTEAVPVTYPMCRVIEVGPVLFVLARANPGPFVIFGRASQYGSETDCRVSNLLVEFQNLKRRTVLFRSTGNDEKPLDSI
jgi:hypothetical protein